MIVARPWTLASGIIILLSVVVVSPGAAQTCQNPAPACVADLRQMCPAELDALFANAQCGNIPGGDLDGQVLYMTDRHGRLKVGAANLVWRGKCFYPDTFVANRWIGNQRRIGSYRTIGPSWIDGRPAIIIDYPRGTPIFSNMHDEIREVAPGLYLGLMFDGCPCPKLRGYFAIQVPKCSCIPACCTGR